LNETEYLAGQMASRCLKPFAVSCAEPSSRAKASRLRPASEEAMERPAKHSTDWEEGAVSRRAFLGSASAAAVGSAMHYIS